MCPSILLRKGTTSGGLWGGMCGANSASAATQFYSRFNLTIRIHYTPILITLTCATHVTHILAYAVYALS